MERCRELGLVLLLHTKQWYNAYRIDGRVDVAEVIGEIPQRLRDPFLQLKSLQHGQHAEINTDVKPQHYHQISSMFWPVGGPGDDERQQDGRQGLGRLPILRGEKVGFYVGVFKYLIEISSFNSHTRAVTHHFHRPSIRKPWNFFYWIQWRKVVEVFAARDR